MLFRNCILLERYLFCYSGFYLSYSIYFSFSYTKLCLLFSSRQSKSLNFPSSKKIFSSSCIITSDLKTACAFIDISVLISTSLARTISALRRLVRSYSYRSNTSRTSTSRAVSLFIWFTFYLSELTRSTSFDFLLQNYSLRSSSSLLLSL